MPETKLDFNHNQVVYSVTEVAYAIKRTVEDHFGRIRLRGEISGWKVATSGHVYFRLKDDGAVMDAVCWKGTASKFSFKAEDGLEVVATGKLTTYPGKSSYQIVVDHMEPAGVGALMAVLEKRRKMFEAEGLFAQERKKKIPFLSQKIGVITSPTGAVIRDILHRISERFPSHVLVWPVAVQGEGAAEQIAAAIEGFNIMPSPPDVLIVARGGGSIEDLWAFNEEVVVRAAAHSRIPLISAVGHETDTTLIDFVSDMRAPTPTAAAELAVPVRSELQLMVGQFHIRLEAGIIRFFSQRAEQLQGFVRGLPKPSQLLQVASQRLDDWSERLQASPLMLLARKEQQVALFSAALRPQTLQQEICKTYEKIIELQSRLTLSVHRLIDTRLERLANISSLLESVNYTRILARGFALVKNNAGELVTSAEQAKTNDSLTIIFTDGEVKVRS